MGGEGCWVYKGEDEEGGGKRRDGVVKDDQGMWGYEGRERERARYGAGENGKRWKAVV